MSYLKIRKPPEYVVEGLKRCPVCDWRGEYATRTFMDLVHCECCGVIFFVNPEHVSDPVAKVTLKEED